MTSREASASKKTEKSPESDNLSFILNFCWKLNEKKIRISMVYFVRNKVNMGVIGKLSGGNAGFYDQIRIYCMWKAVPHVLTAFHCQ